VPGQNRNINGASGNVSPQSNDPQIARGVSERNQVFQNVGVEFEDLGDRGTALAKAILERFQSQAEISETDLEAATNELRAAHQHDISEAYHPVDAPSADAVRNWSATTKLKRKANGRFLLTGSAASGNHPLTQLLRDLRVKPHSLSEESAGIIQTAIDQQADLSSENVWTTLSRSLLLTKMQETNSIVSTQLTTDTSPTSEKKSPAADISSQGVARNPELAATAPSTTGVGSSQGALAARIQNMMGASAKSPAGRKQALRALTEELTSDLQLTDQDANRVSSLLGHVVKAAVSSDGTIKSEALAQAAFAELAEDETDPNQLGSYGMASSLLSLIEGQSQLLGPDKSQAVDNLTANLAAFAVRSFVSEKLGRSQGSMSDEFLSQIQATMGQLTNTAVDSENVITSESSKAFDRQAAETEIAKIRAANTEEPIQSPQVESNAEPEVQTLEEPSVEASPVSDAQVQAPQVETAKADSEPSVSKDVRFAAKQAMEALNINTSDPKNQPIQQAYESIIAASKGDPAQMYMAATNWLDQNIGSNRAEHDAKLLEQGLPPAMLQTMLNDRFATIAAFITNPKEIKEKFLMNERRAGAGANAGLEGNGLGGVGGFRFGKPNSYGTGGLLGPGSPMDADGSKNHIYAQRSLQISSILNDPALSIEDKIFYFMMWFAAYADKEREQKMKEIADLDNQSQENNLKRKDLERNRQALYQSRKVMQQAVQTAESKLRSLSPKHEEIRDVKKDISKLESSENPDQQQIADLRKKLGGLERLNKGAAPDIEKAQQVLAESKTKMMQVQVKIEGHSKQIDQLAANADSGTKSRELLFMELERIQRFRGMLIDMANSFMRDMARRVKEIMQ